MSFIDIGKLTMHRRNEMELRVNCFLDKCDQVISNIQNLKRQARDFPEKLNCEPAELKDRYLSSMKQLEEYMYIITDFNIAISTFDDKDPTEYTPVQDSRIPSSLMLQPQRNNLMDILSEPVPSTSTSYTNNSLDEKPVRKRIPKSEQTLIAFSSTSNSDESVYRSKRDILEKKEIEIQCQLAEDMKKVDVKEEGTSPLPQECRELPAQSVLEVDHAYPATIMGVEGASFWIITEEFSKFNDLITDLTAYYNDNALHLTLEEVQKLTYCAHKTNDAYFRGLICQHPTKATDLAEVYMLDTGTINHVPVDGISPLVARFADTPPFARCCHLAGIDLLDNSNEELNVKIERFMTEHIAKHCTIEVDDNSSESLGVYVTLYTGEVLNDMVVALGLAKSNKQHTFNKTVGGPVHGPPEITEEDLDLHGPEYEDALEAVTGYHNRDEEELCRHYKGAPNKMCFKGSRCKKKHILKHPDGWTRDKMEVVAKCPSPQLPPPGAFVDVLVTYVCHFDRVFVQIQREKEREEPQPSFGVVMPPTTLKALVRDMNSMAARNSYKPLTLPPAPGELVAALYPPDERWYRARVLSTDLHEHSVEVMYIDYGNVVWVKENAVKLLDPIYATLPAQAVRCVLAGVAAKSDHADQWAEAKAALTHLTQDQVMEAHVIARNYDELTIELYDDQGYSVAELLAVKNLITLIPFFVINENDQRTKVVVP